MSPIELSWTAKNGGGNCPPGKCTVFGGGKCPNLGVVNVRILGVVNVCLANNLTPSAYLGLKETMEINQD